MLEKESILENRKLHLQLLMDFGKDYHTRIESKDLIYEFDDDSPVNTKYPYYLMKYRDERIKLGHTDPEKVYDDVNEQIRLGKIWSRKVYIFI